MIILCYNWSKLCPNTYCSVFLALKNLMGWVRGGGGYHTHEEKLLMGDFIAAYRHQHEAFSLITGRQNQAK